MLFSLKVPQPIELWLVVIFLNKGWLIFLARCKATGKAKEVTHVY